MTKAQKAELAAKEEAAKIEALTPEELSAALNELGINHEPAASIDELRALLIEKKGETKGDKGDQGQDSKSVKKEDEQTGPVRLDTKGKFSLFEVKEGWIIKNGADQLISTGSDLDAGRKMLADLGRNQ